MLLPQVPHYRARPNIKIQTRFTSKQGRLFKGILMVYLPLKFDSLIPFLQKQQLAMISCKANLTQLDLRWI